MRTDSIQGDFEAFDEQHPDIYRLFVRFAQELRSAGIKKHGAKSLIERIRWHCATSPKASDMPNGFKIDNRFTSRYVRKLIDERPEFADFFELRSLKAE